MLLSVQSVTQARVTPSFRESARGRRDDDRARRRDDRDRRVEYRRRRRPAPGVGTADDAGLEGKVTAAPPDPGHGCRGLDDVAAEDRRTELDVGVGGEQALV